MRLLKILFIIITSLVLSNPSFAESAGTPAAPEPTMKNTKDFQHMQNHDDAFGDTNSVNQFNDLKKHENVFGAEEGPEGRKIFNHPDNHNRVEGLRQDTKTYIWQDKLKRSVTNLWSAPLEMKYSFRYARQTKTDKHAMGWGLLEGLGRSFARWGAGWLELFTTPFDWPNEFKEPIYEPERVWERETNPNP